MVELNRRLEESESDVRVSDLWFRPNISVKDVSAPFVEDEWTYVKGPFTYEICKERWRLERVAQRQIIVLIGCMSATVTRGRGHKKSNCL